MLKVGPKVNHSCNCNCAEHNQIKKQHTCSCGCCSQPQEDKFEKSQAQVDKLSLQKALPLGAVAGLASAGLVMVANGLLNKALKTSNGLATTVAVGVGIGVANGVINGTIANIATKQAMEEQKAQQQKSVIA